MTPDALDLSETAKAHRTMPSNVRTLWFLCMAEACKQVDMLDVKRDCDLPKALRAWATLALAAAISPKHASAFLRRNRNHAAWLRCSHYLRFCDAADAFGATLQPVWDDAREAA